MLGLINIQQKIKLNSIIYKKWINNLINPIWVFFINFALVYDF